MRGGGGSIVSARDAICLELRLGGGTRYYANTALHEPATYWEPRLLPDEDIVRSTDPHEGYLAALGVTVRLDNTDGAISDLLDTDTIDGATALIYRKVVNNAGVVTSTTTRLKGKCRYVGGDQLAVRIEIMPPAITDLDYFQRKINATAFPTAPDGTVAGKPSTLGLGMTAPFGYCTNSKGKIELIMINDTPNAEKFGGIMGGVFDFSAVYRERADVLTLLTVTTHYVKTLYALDAEGSPHAFITLTSGTWAEGDRYFADIKGLVREGLVTLDGSADYVKIIPAARTNLDFGTTGNPSSFTIVAKDKTTKTGWQVIGGIYDFQSGNKRSWALYFDGGASGARKVILFMSQDGTATKSWACDTTLITDGSTYIIRVAVELGVAVAIWINGTAQSLSGGGGTPYATLFNGKAAGVDFTVGANSNAGAIGNHPHQGGNCYFIVANGYQGITGGDGGDRSTPLEDVISEWQFSGIARVNDAGAYYVRDRVGNNHLTATSLTNADITLISYETTGPRMLDRALRWNDYNWRLDSGLINRTSLGVLLVAFEAAGYNDAAGTWFAGMLPPDFGSVMETSAALREFCWALSCVPYVTPEGRLAFIDFDATTTGSGANVYDEQLGQIVDARLGSPLPKWNKAPRVLYDRLHRNDGSWGSSAVATNQESIDNYGLAEEDAEFALIGNINYLAPLIGRHMLKRSGRPATATIELAGYDAWAEDIGSKPQFTLPNMRGQWQERSLLLYQVEDGIWDYVPKLTGIECGAQCGSVVVTAKGASAPDETGATVLMTADTFLGKSDNGVHVDAHNVTAYGALTYLRHGHHWGNPTACYCVPTPPWIHIGEFGSEAAARAYVDATYWGVPMWEHCAKGYNNINWRSLFRASFAAHAGKTVATVKLRLFVMEKPSLEWKFNISYAYTLFVYDIGAHAFYLDGNYALPGGYQCRSGWSGGIIHRCTDTNWTTASTWFGEGWTDDKISTQLGAFGSAAGLIYVSLDKTYFQAACDGTADGGGGNEVNLVLEAHSAGDYSQNIKIASSRHGTVGYRPALLVVFS